jgi:hypothetical protein
LQADWEFEVGVDAPVIDTLWPGFVDLRVTPERVSDLPEAVQFPGLAAALKRLNAAHSSVWTSKCDFWPVLQPEDFDADELDAPPDCSAHAMGAYIDLLPKSDRAWSPPHLAEAECKRLCGLLSAVPLRCCRADLVIRRAVIGLDGAELGITAYITTCGATVVDASRTLEAALAAFANALCPRSTLQ